MDNETELDLAPVLTDDALGQDILDDYYLETLERDTEEN